MSLSYLVKQKQVTIHQVADYLDALPHQHRVFEVASLSLVGQARLYAKAELARPLTLADFVPEESGELVPVHHVGRNTLPLFRAFEKRFARPRDEAGVLYGYNHGITGRFIGPGYFVAYETGDHPTWQFRGGVVIDYYRVPGGPVPPRWPKVIPNSQRAQQFVYGGTRDFMRRVSAHVTVGRAYKGELPLPSWFVLCRSGDAS